MAFRLVIGLLMTAFAAKGGARLIETIAIKAFASYDTIQLQWAVALILGAIGLLATFYNLKEVHQSQTKGQA